MTVKVKWTLTCVGEVSECNYSKKVIHLKSELKNMIKIVYFLYLLFWSPYTRVN